MNRYILTVVAWSMLMSIAIGQTIIDYRGLEIQSPDPTGAAGLRLQNNFKALADRIGPSNLTATGTPSVDDDVDEGYYAGSLWYDTVGGVLYWCADNTDGAAVWHDLSTSGGSASISDIAYAESWNGVTTIAPSKNALYAYLSGLSSVYQAADADLTTWAGVTSSANGRSLVSAENYAAMRELLSLADVANVKAYGATGDGVTDDTSAIQAALDAYEKVYIPTGTYVVGNLTAGANQSIMGDGAGSVLRFKAGETGYLLECSTNSVVLAELSFNGGLTSTQAANETQGDRSGVHMSSIATFSSIRNCRVYGFSDTGLALNGNQTARNGTPSIIGCNLYFNWIGIDTGVNNVATANIGGEFVSIVETTCRANRYGLLVNSGNLVASGCHFDDNGYGVTITDAFNNAHGSISASTINHNTVLAVLIDGVTNGFSFTGCQSWYGGWTITDSSGISITGCGMGAAPFILTGGGPCLLKNNWFSGTPSITRSSDKFVISDNIFGSGSVAYGSDLRDLVVDSYATYDTVAHALRLTKVGIGVDPVLPLHAVATAAAPATSGTTPTGIQRLGGAGGYSIVMDSGVYDTSPYGFWMRVTDRTNLAITYPLILQPTGGRTGIDETNPDYKLDVNGTFGFTPGTDSAPIDNGDVTLDFPTATTLRLRGKNGGTVRNLTLPITDAALTDGQVLKVSSGTPTWATDTDTLGSIGSVANGDIAIYDSGWTRLAKGDDGQVLKLAAGLPSWAADTDTNTTYTAGDGLKLTGTDFDLNLQTGGGLEIDTGQLTLTSTHLTGEIGITIDGAGSEIADGVKGFVRVPYACTITGVYLMADQTGSIVVDVWKDTFANYPPTVADTITASAKPTLSSAISGSDTTLTDWTKAVSAGDVIGFNVDSCTTIERLTLQITTTK